jgi:TIR domain
MEHPEQPDVFLCYSHEDQRWLDELLLHLKPLENRRLIDCWSDQEIAPGRRWQEEIERALASAKVAVLLVSPAFLASSFIAEKELPSLLRAAAKGDLTILWIPVCASNYKHTELVRYQAAHPPEKPLNTLRKSDREKALVEISEKILEAAGSARRAAPSPPRSSEPGEAKIAAGEDFPILRRSRGVWAALTILFLLLLLLFPPPLPLLDSPVSEQVPFLTWQRLGWLALSALLIPGCLFRYVRERFVYKAADQLTDTVLLVTGKFLDLAVHWRHHARRWAIGLVIAAILIFPVALFAFGRFRSHLDQMDNVSELRNALQRFVCYGRLQGGNEAELAALTRAYGIGGGFPPEALSTPELRLSSRTIADLYRLQNDLLKADFQLRRRRIIEFWQEVVQRPDRDPPREEVELGDFLTHLALKARARSLLLSQNGISERLSKDIDAAEAGYDRLRELALRLGDETTRRRLLGVALDGSGTLTVQRYRVIMTGTGKDVELRKAVLLNEAAALYLASSSAESGGDPSEDARTRAANHQIELEMYLLKEALAANDDFAEGLGHRLYQKYVAFRDDSANIERWVEAQGDGLEERARFSHNPDFFLTVAQINAVAAERLLQEKPLCRQRMEGQGEESGPFCAQVEKTLRNGLFNLATAVYLGQPPRGLAKEPGRHLVCVYFSHPVTRQDAEFLFARFDVKPDVRACG